MTDINELKSQIKDLLESKENEVIRNRLRWAVEENMPSDRNLLKLVNNLLSADNKTRKQDIFNYIFRKFTRIR